MSAWKFAPCLAAALVTCVSAGAAEPIALTVSVTGLFEPGRDKELREVFERYPEVKLVTLDFDRAQAVLHLDAAKFDPKAKPADTLANLNDRVRNLSSATFGAKAASAAPRDKLTRVEVAVAGLDCRACSLFAYEVVAGVEGVEQATASFKDGRVTALIDPTKTDRAKLEAALKRRGVTVR